MNTSEWAELHGETGEEKEVYYQVRSYPFATFVNEHVDYEMLFDITIFEDGDKQVEIIGEHLVLFDDDGNISETIECHLPRKYRDELIEKAYEHEGF